MVEERIAAEITALWEEIFGEPPPEAKDSGVLLQQILESLPTVDYHRFITGRPGNLDVLWSNRRP